jgi:hypothetical protein
VERYLILWHLGRAGLSRRVSVALPRPKEVFTAADKYIQIQTPGNYPEENIQHTEHGESLKSRSIYKFVMEMLMYMTLRILSSNCSSLFSFLCGLSSKQATPSVSVPTKLFLFSFHVLPSFLICCLYLCLGPQSIFLILAG